ncbi:MAG TPA: FIST C-terminal domain-containing protein [Candidatus Onthoplasma faecipullorum]|nr:FIST C-terminal domain-containing protein [Candidatus Onthoplasma faecipullorum]
MKALTGFSKNKNAYQAGLEAAKMAGKNKDAKLVFAYMSCDYKIKDVIKGIKEVYSCPVIGNTSFTGVIMPEGYIGGDEPFVGIMVLSDPSMVVGVGFADRKAYQSARDAGEAATKAARVMTKMPYNDEPDLMYMTASPTEEEFFLKGANRVVGRVPLFGGSAADNTISGNWSLYLDNKVTGEGVAVALIYMKNGFVNEFTGAYRETKDMGIITKVEGTRQLVSIDGVPAVKKYAQWRGRKPSEFMGAKLLSETITSPLGVKDRLGDLIAIRHPMNGNDDYSMNIGANLAEGTTVIRMEATVDELISSVGKTLKKLNAKCKKPVVAYHLVHCGGRRAGIDARINEVYKEIKKNVNGVPFIMEFTFGEYGYVEDGNNTTGGLMLSFTAFTK